MINPSKCYLDLAHRYGVGKHALRPILVEGYGRGVLGPALAELDDYVTSLPLHLKDGRPGAAGFCLGRIHLMLRQTDENK